jgi:inosine-uridine nucleoside N-ribohydrolase
MKQTAVDNLLKYFIKEQKNGCSHWCIHDLIAQLYVAKEIEKKQITETFVKVSRAHQEALGNKLSLQDMIDYKKIAEVYYNEEYDTKKD